MITPAGAIDTRRLPGSGAGPSPDRALIGSEGIYGIITQAWMRVSKRPTFRAATTVAFKDYWKAVDAVRVISQSGLFPANLRLLDAEEAGITGAGRQAHSATKQTLDPKLILNPGILLDWPATPTQGHKWTVSATDQLMNTPPARVTRCNP